MAHCSVEKTLVSIIIPVYNVEKFIKHGVQNILCQDYPNIEVILVDDGSTDKSGNLCDEWSKRDARIRVFHKENGVVVSARHIGILNSKGKYLYFFI